MLLAGVSGNEAKNDFEIFLSKYAWLLCVIVVAIIIATIIAIYLIKGKKNKSKSVKKEKIENVDELLLAVGGQENIIECSASGSRLSIKFKNKDLIDRNKLTELGIKNVVMMSDKITLVTELDNQYIVEKIKNRQQI